MKLFARRQAPATTRGYSVIDNELTVSGDLRTTGTVRVDGRLEGSLHKAGTLIIGAEGSVVGNIEASEVVVGGTLQGNLTASQRVEVQATATINGDIRASAVQLMEGGKVHGHISINPIGADIATAPPERRLTLTPSASARAIAQG